MSILPRVNEQIVRNTRAQGEGNILYNFRNGYNFETVSYPHGEATVKGTFQGNAIKRNSYYIISGIMTYEFSDLFTDPARLRDKVFGNTSNPQAVSEWWRMVSDFGGAPYPVIDFWQTEVLITAKESEINSMFGY